MNGGMYTGVEPFWFWNGEIKPDEVRRQIRAMKAQGVRGFFIHPRQGMDLPYMSDHFLKMIGVAVDTARRESMEMWLYDEYPYPSGVAGGELLLHPEYAARVLKSDVFDVSGHVERDIPWGKVLYARAFPLENGRVNWDAGVDLASAIGIVYLREIFQGNTGLSAYNRKRFFTGEHAKRLWWDAPRGEWRVFLYCECEMGDFKYFGGFVDPICPEAMRDYVRLTHDRYYGAFPEAFGSVIKGIYTDEIAPNGHAPMWSPRMPALFYEKYGRDLIERLPAFSQATAGDDEKFLYDYNSLVIEAFMNSYDRPIRAWCDAHGILYTGEKVHMRGEQIGCMHIPGIDTGHQKAGTEPALHTAPYRSNPKSAASYAHFTGDNTALCEAYHSVGWDMTMRDMRWMADWMCVQGIGLIVPHAYYYTDDALRKYDAPPSAFETMPWYAHNRLYTAHVDFVAKLVRNGARRARILLIDSTSETISRRAGKRGEGNALCRLEYALGARHMDYYIIDRDLLRETAARDGRITLCGEKFDALVFPGMRLCEEEALGAAARAMEGGAFVCCSECAPARNITTGEALKAGALTIPLYESADACAQALCARIPAACHILENGRECARVLAARFSMDGEEWLYTVNTRREEVACELSLPDAPGQAIALVDTVTGAETRVSGDAARFSHAYAPFSCAVFRTARKAREDAYAPKEKTLDPWKAYPCALLSRNLLRIGVWNANLGGNELRVSCMPVIDQLLLGDSRIPAAEKSGFGCVKKLQFPPMPLEYRFDFLCAEKTEILLATEKGGIHGKYEIFLNGENVTDGFAEQFVYKRGNLARDVTGQIKIGRNALLVKVFAERDDDGIVNPLYLAGNFGLLREDGLWRIGTPAREASPMSPENAGMPFFSGVAEYDVTDALGEFTGDPLEISIRDWRFEHCAEFRIDGESVGARAWNPYTWRVSPAPGARAVLRVYGTLLAAYEGARFDQDAHQTISLDR